FGGIGPAATAAEPPLPLRLVLWEVDPAPPALPEFDSIWRAPWFVEPAEEEPPSPPAVFRWPEFAITIVGERLQVQSGEKWEPYYTGRLELGSARLQKMEGEQELVPA